MSSLLFPRLVLRTMPIFEPAAPPPVATELAQTDYRIPASWGTITSVNIGAANANRVVWVSAITFTTTSSYDLTASVGVVTKLAEIAHSANAGLATWWEITGITSGTTVDLTKTGTTATTAHVCVFRGVGYEAEASGEVMVDSEPGNDTIQSSVAPSIDAGGAFVAHGGRYTAISGSGFTVSGGGVVAGTSTQNRAWGWFNDASGGSRTVTASAATAVGRKCLSLLRLQAS